MEVKGHKYNIDDNGVICLENPVPFNYDQTYVEERYDHYGWQTTAMSLLRLHFIRDHMEIRGKSVLDVGYGNGDFLKTCYKQGMYAWGHDVSGYPLWSRIRIAPSMFEAHYDLITFFDSLEHFTSLDFVKDLDCKHICVSVPWCHYPDDKVDFNWFVEWKHLRPEEHFFHFSRKALVKFMESSGYYLVDYDNIEDSIRGVGPDGMPNILTAFFTKGKRDEL